MKGNQLKDNEIDRWREEVEDMRKWADRAAQECATANLRLYIAETMVARMERKEVTR